MGDFFEKMHLREVFTVELPVEKMDFVNLFTKKVDKGSVGLLSNPLKELKRSDNKFIGQADMNGFEIRTHKNIFKRRKTTVRSRGTFTQLGRKLLVKTEIDGMTTPVKISAAITAMILLAFAFVMTRQGLDENGSIGFMPIALVIYLAVFLGIMFFRIRYDVAKVKAALENIYSEIESELSSE